MAARMADDLFTISTDGFSNGLSDGSSSGLQNVGIAIEIVAPALAAIVVSLRVYIRTTAKNLGWDDAWICAAMALDLVIAIGSVMCMKLSYIGIDRDSIPPHDPTPGLQWQLAVGLLYGPTLTAARCSVLAFLLRIADVKDGVRISVWALGVFNLLQAVSVFFAILFSCSPVELPWKPQIQGGHCIDRAALAVAASCLGLLADVAILALPFWIFLDLRMARKEKAAVLVIFSVGFLAVVAGIVRIVYFLNNDYSNNSSIPYLISFTTAAIQTNLAIIAACCPALWPLARKLFPTLFPTLVTLPRAEAGDNDYPADEDGSQTTSSSSHPLRANDRTAAPKKSLLAAIHHKAYTQGGGRRAGGVHTNYSIGGTPFLLQGVAAGGGTRRENAWSRSQMMRRHMNTTQEEDREDIVRMTDDDTV